MNWPVVIAFLLGSLALTCLRLWNLGSSLTLMLVSWLPGINLAVMAACFVPPPGYFKTKVLDRTAIGLGITFVVIVILGIVLPD